MLLALTGCDEESRGALRVYHSPYGEVEWGNEQRLLAQHHDHNGTNAERILAYDAAGYDVIGLMDYSGDPDLAFALRTRLWTPEEKLKPELLASLTSIRFFVANAEEVGVTDHHFTSPFLTTYVERWRSAQSPAKQAWQYESLEEFTALVDGLGGMPCLAHPWGQIRTPNRYAGLRCVEMYSAFAAARREQGDSYFSEKDRNETLLRNWDTLLRRDASVLGIAVNDHFGPYASADSASASVRDSGKIIVLVPEATPGAYHQAFQAGAFFAVKDIGATKGDLPVIESISVEQTSILIDTPDEVTWIANGEIIGHEPLLDYARLPSRAVYLRAEIRNAAGNTLYTQAFSIRPVGDADGDDRVDIADQFICHQVSEGIETAPDRVRACLAISQP